MKSTSFICFSILLSFFQFSLNGQISLVKDITQGTGFFGDNFYFGKTLNAFTFFSRSGDLGNELYKTDGTPQGTFLIKDIVSGSIGSSPHRFQLVNNRVVFICTEELHGTELWVTDGSTCNTKLIKDINPGGDGSYPSNFLVAGNYLYFIASNSNVGSNLWRTDGTTEGTIMIRDYDLNEVTSLANINDEVFFAGSNNFGNELWKTDGTIDGTIMISGFSVQPSMSTNPTNLYSYQGVVYFQGMNEELQTGSELWKSDGTIAGTVQVMDISLLGSSQPMDFYGFEGKVYFTADDGIHGRELWVTDGTELGTMLVMDVNTGNQGSDIKDFKTLNGKLIFNAETALNGRELYVSNGTAAGTSMLEINLGINNSTIPGIKHIMGSTMYYQGVSSSGNVEIWKTDGTLSGTMVASNLVVPGSELSEILHGETDFMFLLGFLNGHMELFISDGGMSQSVYSTTNSPGSTPITHLHSGSNKLFFQGLGLYKSDGTSSGTLPQPGSAGQFILPQKFDSIGSITVLSGIVNNVDQMLLKTDGTNAGTLPLINTYISGNDWVTMLGKVGSKVIFTAYNPVYGMELYASDGSVGGTSFIKDIYPGASSSSAMAGCEFNGFYYFSAESSSFDVELWRTDGTTSGTSQVTDLVTAGNQSEAVYTLGAINGALIFMSPLGLCKTDGTAGNFQVIDPLFSLQNSQTITLNFNNNLYFSYDDGIHGEELWKTDGTASGTQLVYDINPGPDGSQPFSIKVLNDTLYFSALNNNVGYEIWKSNGEVGDAELFMDLYPGPNSSNGYPRLVYNQKLYFTANNGTLGDEIWATEGTPSSTYLCGDLNAGVVNSYANDFTLHQGQIYFSASNVTYGKELWKLNPQLSILPISTIDVTTCNDCWISPTNKSYYHTGMYIDTLQDVSGIDSAILYIFLKIKQSSQGMQFVTSCNPYQWIDGITYSSSQNQPFVILQNSEGCDSTITLHLTFHPEIQEGIIASGDTMLIATGGYNYQWFDCDINQWLFNEIYDTLIPPYSGNFACIIYNQEWCSDTTECLSILGLESKKQINFSVFPNPSASATTVEYEGNQAKLIIFDNRGLVIYCDEILKFTQIDMSNFSTGIYFIQLITDEGVGLKRFIKM